MTPHPRLRGIYSPVRQSVGMRPLSGFNAKMKRLPQNGSAGNRFQQRFLRKVQSTIAEFDMIEPGESILLAVSGGPDSVALVHVLCELSATLGCTLGLAHFNHGLRGIEADRDAEFVFQLAHRLNLGCYTDRKDALRHKLRVKTSLEEAARQLRYGFLQSIARENGFHKIAMAHHANDNAELMLMFLLRGSGVGGLTGIPPMRNNLFIRPLIRVTRKEILKYLQWRGAAYVTDRSNLDNRFMRNRIRNRLVPLLESGYNPEIVPALNRLADILTCDQQWLEELLMPLFRDSLIRKTSQMIELSLPKLSALHKAAQRRVLRMAISEIKGDLRRITYRHTEALIQLISTGKREWVLDLPDAISAHCRTGRIVIRQETFPLRERRNRTHPAAEKPVFRYRIHEPVDHPMVITIAEINRHLRLTVTNADAFRREQKTGQHTAFFDMKNLEFPLTIRNVRSGDRFTPLGMNGSQKVKKYFIDHKIPVEQRGHCPVMTSRHRIIWLVGCRIDEHYKVLPTTRRVLKAELQLV